MPKSKDFDDEIESGRTGLQRPIESPDGISFPEGHRTSFDEMVVSSPEPGMTKYNAAKNQEDVKLLDEE